MTFELPTRNVSLNESAREVAQTERAGYALTSILTLRGELDSQLYVLCAARNAHGARRRQLHFHHASECPCNTPGFWAAALQCPVLGQPAQHFCL